MVIATFGESTGWAGKTITREGDVFTLEGHGPITPADVMEYDRQGQLVWANDGTRAWVGAKAKAPSPSEPSSGEGTAASAMATGAGASSSRPGISRRRVIITVSAVAVVAVLAILALSGMFGAFRGASGTVADTWPDKLEGTWKAKPSDFSKVVFSRGGATATVTMVDDAGGELSFIFGGDTVEWDERDGEAPSVFTRQPGSKGDFVGDYDWVTLAGTVRLVASYADSAFTIITRWPDNDSIRWTFTISDDMKTLVWYGSETGKTITMTRQ